jgi:acetylornithine deacetylase
MRIIEGHKSGYEFTTEFAGLEDHASQPDRGVNAVEYAVQYIARLLELADAARKLPGDDAFDPPWTTVNVRQIEGGIARNVIPKSCNVEWEIRSVTSSQPDAMLNSINDYAASELLPLMRKVHPEADIINRVVSAVGPFERMPESEAVALVAALTGSNAAGVVSFSTEAGLCQAASIQAVVCGPGHIEQAHRPNEFLERTQLGACLSMIDGLVDKLSGPT